MPLVTMPRAVRGTAVAADLPCQPRTRRLLLFPCLDIPLPQQPPPHHHHPLQGLQGQSLVKPQRLN